MFTDPWRRPMASGSARALAALVLGLAMSVAAAGRAVAQSAEIKVYTGEIADPGTANVTLHSNYIAEGTTTGDTPQRIVPDRSLTGGTEWAYGVTPWLEAGLYLPIYTLTRDRHLLLDGAEMRALFVVPHADERRFFYGVNLALEFDTHAFSARSPVAEIRPILGGMLGSVRITVNPILEAAFDGASKIEFAPAARADYSIDPHWGVAFEDYAHLGTLARWERLADQQQILFVVGDYRRAAFSLEAGVGRGLTHASDALTFKLILSHDLPHRHP